jgi:hypothetical protein
MTGTHGGTVTSVTQLSVANPGSTPGAVAAPKGAIVEWGNNSNFPDFEIEFASPSPTNQGRVFAGTKTNPITFTVTGEPGLYPYTIHYCGIGGGTCQTVGPFPFSVRSCPTCTG